MTNLSIIEIVDAFNQLSRQLARHIEVSELDPVKIISIRAMIRARRLRDRYFDPSLFADPAWDILLDLAAARTEARDVAISSACIAAAVPPTTALRWISVLVTAGLIERYHDPNDGRRSFLRITATAAEAMDAYLVERSKIEIRKGAGPVRVKIRTPPGPARANGLDLDPQTANGGRDRRR